MNIKAYSVDTNHCDKSRLDGVMVFSENGLFHDPKRQANMYMALSHEYIDADVSVYLAGNMILKEGISLEDMVGELLGRNDIAIYHHHKRNCMYKEAGSIGNKEVKEIMEIQMNKYRKLGYPENNGLVETGMIIRRHNDRVIAFNNAWFAELCLHSKRSQLSFNYVISVFPKLKVNIIDGNVRKNKYIYQRKHNLTYLKKSISNYYTPNSGYRTIVFIRSRYIETISNHRLGLFQKYCINSLKDQKDRDFEVHVLSCEQTVNQIKALDWGDIHVEYKIQYADQDFFEYINDLRETYMSEPSLQIRLDNDDWVDTSFISKTKALVQGHDKILVTFHPTKYLHDEKGKRYFSQKKYSRNRPSMFFAIFQKEPQHWILDEQHGRMGRLFENSLYIKRFGLCNLVIHKENTINTK